MSKFCPKCGKEMKEDENFCSSCGGQIELQADKADKFALTGMILGLVSIIAWIIPLFGYPIAICGIVFSAKGLKSTTGKGKAIAGLILSIIFLLLTLGNSCLGALISLDYYM